ncbi:4'-phosphopantetheinyl transferase family protein [Allonocardiopsis opalescens]|uniref:4'-phosphopantetheinyl transferase EntD n=1 Tax=Allonocardiopsis opalescens TaxID=1144618 RepID=A0A2T0QE96_9ACTN|nr:4'-phosphopantetheinyl transferase superfamily protein [Allonocardiopsis opalescens]PRY02257.1 4'-phosphopantetheinyl transferase EntD [Allonocardiopsis opalescens]
MIEELLPGEVACAESFDDPPEAVLLPEEEPEVARAVDKRRREFTTGRHCARLALAKLSVPPVPLPRGERGAPVWPEGIAGSITHCAGYRGAVAARTAEVRSVGIDAEPNGPLPEGVLDAVSLPEERDWIGALDPGATGVHWDRLLFSAKESVYKAWYPLARRFLGFAEARITVDPRAGAFTARLLVPGPVVDGAPLTGFTGRWLVRGGLVLTAIALPAAANNNDQEMRTPDNS